MPLDAKMRKLKFIAQCEGQLNQTDGRQVTQRYVTDLLSTQLPELGFQTLSQSGDQIAISVDDQALPLSVTCQGHDAEGHMLCEIISYPEEGQDWLERITEQSLLNQLAQAVENTLKKDQAFSQFEWKTDQR